MSLLPKIRREDPCDTCVVAQAGHCKIKTAGSRNGKILVVTGKPRNDKYSRRKHHLTEDAQEVFIKTMLKNGFEHSDFVYHSSTRCAFDKDDYTTKEQSEAADHCREYLIRVIEKMKPEIIIPLGVDAARAVYGKAKKITKIRGALEWAEEYNAYIFPMIDPTMVVVYPQNDGVFQADARALRRLIRNDFDQELVARTGLGEYSYVEDLQFLIDQKPDTIVFDTETEGLRWAEDEKKLLTLQLCTEPGKAYLISWDHPDRPASRKLKRKLRRQLNELMCQPGVNITGHNLKFDVLWMFTRLGIRLNIGEDTLMLAAILDENNKNKDLSTLTKMYVPEMAGYDDVFNRTYDKSRMADVPLEKILEYGCGDVDACFRLIEVFWEMLEEDPKLVDYYYNVSIPGLNSFVDMELAGMMIHEGRLDELREALAEHVDDLERSIISQVPRTIRQEHIEKGLKLSRSVFLRDILFDHPDGFRLTPKVFTKTTAKLKDESKRVPSTSSKDHLPFFFEECPFTEELSEWMKLNRLLGTNIDKFKENYMLGDYIYPSYQLHVTVTGRTSSQDPNGQNFPKRGDFAKKYRRCFIPPPDYFMIEADLSQAELRIAADMSGDKTMLSIYNNNGDIHKATALIVMGVSEEQFNSLPSGDQKLARFKAKAVNFGFIYGMGWRNFITYAKTQYGVEFTTSEAKRIRREYFERYPYLVAWHKQMREFARRHGYVRSYTGRVRHLPMINSSEEGIRMEAERQAINSPVQEFGSTLGVIALSNIMQDIDPQYLKITGFVHDALYALVPKQYAEWAAKTMKWYMENVDLEGMFDRKMKVPIVADVSIGTNGGDQYEMAGLDIDMDYDWESQLEYDQDKGNPFPFEMPEQLEPENNGWIDLPAYRVHTMERYVS